LHRALFFTPESPYPTTGGGSLRAASLLHYLARRYRVDAIVFRQPGESIEIPAGLVNEVQIIDLPPHARHLPARILRNASRMARRMPPLIDRFSGFGPRIARVLRERSYELAVIEHFWCAPYWEQVTAVSRRTVLDLHNIESVLHSRCGAAERFPAAVAHRWFCKPCEQLERQWWPRFSTLLVPSQADAAAVRSICDGTRPVVYPNAIPRLDRPHQAEEHVIAFSGNMEYHPNVMAVGFFRRGIWPQLRGRWPQLVWRLIGKNAHAVRKYTRGDERIEVTGPVPDAIAELAKAQVAVVPLLAGSGTRLKIMEAWAAGRAVVSTTLGAEGLEATDGENILLADGPEEFAAAVSKVLESRELRMKLGASGRHLYERRYTWEAAWACLEL
jgi:glycosyltransferase involved in cell wall biosynthesis